MKRGRTLPVVRISGRPYEMGVQAGRKCSKRAREYRTSMAEAIDHSTGVSWDRAMSRAARYVSHAEAFYPEFVEELRGYGEGESRAIPSQMESI